MRGLVLVIFGALMLACAGGTSTTAPPPPPSTPTGDATTPPADAPATLVAPWNTLNLPIGDGDIVEADSDKLLVAYDTGSLITLSDSWIAALNAAGYTKQEDVSSPGITALVFAKGGQMLGLATGQEEGVNFAYMEDLGRVRNSAIRNKQMPGMRGRRRGGRRGGAGGH